MKTKMKNIKYTNLIKSSVFVCATIIFILMSYNLAYYTSEYSSYNGINPSYKGSYIEKYDNEYNENYYEPYSETIKTLSGEIKTFDDMYKIISDDFKHPIHEILDIDLEDNIDQGVRYVLYDRENDKIVGDDGISKGYSYNDIGNETSYISYIRLREKKENLSEEVINTLELENYDGNSYVEAYYTLKVFYDDEVAKPIIDYLKVLEEDISKTITNIFILIILFISVLIYFIIVSGKDSYNGDIKYTVLDKIYLDIQSGTVFILFILYTLVYYEFIPNIVYGDAISNEFIMVTSIFTSSIIIFYISSIGKRIKEGTFLKHTLTYFFLNKILLIINNIINRMFIIKNSSLAIKMTFILICLLSIFSMIIPVVGIPILLLITIILNYNNLKLNKVISSIKSGKSFKYRGKITHYPLIETYKNLESISNNINQKVEENIKAQNTKTELITNVSHDLRTPLTSIIGYVDLMNKNIDVYDDETKKYILILKEKSERMSKMIQDVFDLSKTASGDTILNMEEINIKKLIEQTLEELEVIPDENNIELNLNSELYIYADGDKMYRVLQNLIENALKYTLKGTRIYIDVYEENNNNIIVIKNISSYKMNFTEETIKARFTRGEQSRTTNGNGLGLSIAEVYTNANLGKFDIKIDGDMFKVIITFAKYHINEN